MTPEEHRTMDSNVAEKVMGWTVQLIVGAHDAVEEWRDPQGWRYGPSPKPYSTEIADAWQVAEKLQLAVVPDTSGGWRARQAPFDPSDGSWYEENMNDWEWAETAPLAICAAALSTVSPSAAPGSDAPADSASRSD